MDPFPSYFRAKRDLIEPALDRYLPPPAREPRVIHECMRYSTDGGKRLRPLITLAVAEMLGCDAERVLPTCAAIEFIHTHSLILDDLPCMDNDDYRRGRLTSHKRFGESVALLAADALLNLAISLLGANHRLAGIPPEVALEIIREVGETVGTDGVIGGQIADLTFSPMAAGPAVLERIHVGKTARLFRLSARAGAFVARANPNQLDRVGLYAEQLGLAFQIMDDLLDHTDGSDGARNRSGVEPSYARSFTPAVARTLATEATDKALEALCLFWKEAEILRSLAEYNLERAI
jgi:geranylgeranyl diphosphate synthase type II